MRPVNIDDSDQQPYTRWRKISIWFVTGLLVIGPIVLTIWLTVQLFLFMDGVLGKPIQFFLGRIIGISFFQGQTIHGIGFVALILLILVTGWFARQYLGIRVVKLLNTVLERIPLISKIYIAITQISEAFLGGRRDVFKHAVMIEYPKKGIYSIGFVTQDTRGPAQSSLPKDTLSIFLPTTPNPTSGFLLFVPKKEVIFLDVSVEEALKLVVSAGVIIPIEGRGSREAARALGIPIKSSTELGEPKQ